MDTLALDLQLPKELTFQSIFLTDFSAQLYKEPKNRLTAITCMDIKQQKRKSRLQALNEKMFSSKGDR